MNPSNVYRLYIDEAKNQVVVLGVNNITTAYPSCENLQEAYNLAYELKEQCLKQKICVEVYHGIDEAKGN